MITILTVLFASVAGLKLFGETYSGLEYDYKGLVHCYKELDEVEKMAQYTFILNQWKVLRGQLSMQENRTDLEETGPLQPLPDLINFYFKD